MFVFYMNMNIFSFIPNTNNLNHSLKFKAREMINVANIDKKLLDVRQNNFINGIYDNDVFEQNNKYEKTMIQVYSAMPQYQNYSAKIYDVKKENDAPYKIAAIVNNVVRKNKDSNIHRETPDIFKGLDKNEVFKSLDVLSYVLRDIGKKEHSFNIGNKEINVDYVGEGKNSTVYKLSDNEGNKVAIKNYKKPEEVNFLSLFGELALYQALKNEKINNIPTLYMANPVSMKVEDLRKEWTLVEDVDNIKDYDGYKGGWAVVEYITPDTPTKNEGITLHEWLKSKELYHIDINSDNCIGKYIIDLGGVTV